MIGADLISDLESCDRRGFYSRDWLPPHLHPTEITRQAIYAALADTRQDAGERAGEEVIGTCSTVGLDLKANVNFYDIGLHHASLADIVTTWLKTEIRGSLAVPEDKAIGNLTWVSSCLADPAAARLVRIVLVDHFSDDRIASEGRAWYSLGEVAVYNVPMTVYLVSLGASKGGKRHSAWSKGLLHPRNRQLRFSKQAKKVEGFKESWRPIWREDHAEIDRETWLRAMQRDGVILDLTRMFTIESLAPSRRAQVLEVLERKGRILGLLEELPDPSYSACDWPRPCPFRNICFAPARVTPDVLGFRRR